MPKMLAKVNRSTRPLLPVPGAKVPSLKLVVWISGQPGVSSIKQNGALNDLRICGESSKPPKYVGFEWSLSKNADIPAVMKW